MNVNLPRVETGLATPEGTSAVKALMIEHEGFRDLKVSHAMALVRKGTKPYQKPPKAVVQARRKTDKAARLARKAHRS